MENEEHEDPFCPLPVNMSWSCDMCSAPWVPTGMNIGVSAVKCGSFILATRALPCTAVTCIAATPNREHVNPKQSRRPQASRKPHPYYQASTIWQRKANISTWNCNAGEFDDGRSLLASAILAIYSYSFTTILYVRDGKIGYGTVADVRIPYSSNGKSDDLFVALQCS